MDQGRESDRRQNRLIPTCGSASNDGCDRALAMRPELILFDEPTSALDPELIAEVLQVMGALSDSGLTLVIVTHEKRFARRVADRVIFMDAGAIVEQGSPAEIFDTPREERLKDFLAHLKH